MRSLPPVPGRWLLSLFGLGRVSPAPGSLASFATFTTVVVAQWLGGAGALAAGALFAFGVATTLGYGGGAGGGRPGHRDPSWVVSDEVAGQALALAGAVPFRLGWMWVLCFPLFRLFDVTKPGPIRRLERLPGGVGILADDLAAGLVAGILAAALGWGVEGLTA